VWKKPNCEDVLAMMHEVFAPKSGIYDSDVRVAAWLAREGEEVAIGDPLFEMETDKVTVQVEAEESGWLHILVDEGTDVPIGTTVAILGSTVVEYRQAASGPAQ
jgi:pyruvate/2-oxoglutarate dehydrogenase complex dihydrolipoamide acyltransferase (E2) component